MKNNYDINYIKNRKMEAEEQVSKIVEELVRDVGLRVDKIELIAEPGFGLEPEIFVRVAIKMTV